VSDLPASWVSTKLAEVAEVHDYLREPVNAKERAARIGPYPYYGATGQVGWIDAYRQDGEYVLLGEDGAPFFDPVKPKAYLVTGKVWVNNHAHVLRGIESICENRFLLHALNHANYRGYANGTTRLKLTQGAMLELPIWLAPFGEQKRVVDKLEELLSDLDAGVAALKRARISLQRYRAAALKAAVEGRLTEKWRAARPHVEPTEKVLERILAERRKRWEDGQLAKYAERGQSPSKGWKDKYPEPVKPDISSLPTLPRAWRWATLDELACEVKNGTARAPRKDATGHRILRINAVRPFSVDLDEIRHVDLPEAEAREAVIRNGDLLFTRYNGSPELVGVAGLVRRLVGQVLHPDKLIRVRALGPSVLAEYLELACNVGSSREHIRRRTRTTAGQAGVSGGDIRQIPIPVPPIEEIRQLVEEVARSLSLISASEIQLEAGLRRASSLRRSILKRAFEGKLVPQHPNDEPASEFLKRIRAQGSNREGNRKRAPRGRRCPAVKV